MSWAGIIAGALGGGAQVVNQQAAGHIANEQRTQLAQELSAIEEQKQLRIMEAQSNRARSDELWRQGPELQGLMRGNARAAAQDAADVQVSTQERLNPIYAQRAAGEADARVGAEVKALKDPEYIKALAAKARATHIDSAASLAQADLLRLQAKDLKRLDKLYDDALAIQNDPSLPEDQKRAKLQPIQTSIVAIKSKTGQVKERDPELDTQEVTDEVTLPDGTVRRTKRKEVRRAGSGSGQMTEADAHAQARQAIANRADPRAVNERLRQMGFAPLGQSPAVNQIPTGR